MGCFPECTPPFSFTASNNCNSECNDSGCCFPWRRRESRRAEDTREKIHDVELRRFKHVKKKRVKRKRIEVKTDIR